MDDQDEENREIPAEEGGTEEPLWGEGTTEEEVMIPTEEIPIVLTVEAGKIKMNLDKLLQLAPGNVIEMPLKPEAAVHLTINGKAVAKGELVKIGDAVGVKILKIGR